MENQSTGSKSAATAQSVPELPGKVSIERVSTYKVFDAHDQEIGKASAIWLDCENQPAFLGIKTAKLFGKTHIIPACGAEVNHQAERIRVPCGKEIIDEAPSFSPSEELDEAREQQIIDYFMTKGACQPTATPQSAPPTTSPAKAETAERGETVVPLHEEQMKVGKQSVEAGGVRLRKVVHTETVQQPVELQREEVQIERVPAAGQPASPEKAFQGEDIYIPLRREEPRVEKEPRVREEVHARKTAETEQQGVSGEVRKEDIEVEREHDRRKAA